MIETTNLVDLKLKHSARKQSILCTAVMKEEKWTLKHACCAEVKVAVANASALQSGEPCFEYPGM